MHGVHDFNRALRKQRQANLFEFRPVSLQISARLAIVVIVSE